VPKLDDPLPRFIDDGAAKKLIQAARGTDDPFARLAVEFLARTGLRRGEFLDLKIDSVVQIGAAYWLHVPLGKLRTDRYIPLRPQLKETGADLLEGLMLLGGWHRWRSVIGGRVVVLGRGGIASTARSRRCCGSRVA